MTWFRCQRRLGFELSIIAWIKKANQFLRGIFSMWPECRLNLIDENTIRE